MEREKDAEAKKLLAEVEHILGTRPLTPEKRDALERHAARLASALAIQWLPTPWTTRIIMGALFALGLQQAWSADYLATFILWALLPLFSPYVVAEASFATDKLRRRLHATRPYRSPVDERQTATEITPERPQSKRPVATNERARQSLLIG
jgi:hypothetical protein